MCKLSNFIIRMIIKLTVEISLCKFCCDFFNFTKWQHNRIDNILTCLF